MAAPVITIKAGDIVGPLATALRIASRKETIPVLQYALLEVGADGQARLSATDLDLTFRCMVKATATEPARVLVPLSRFADVVKLVDADAAIELVLRSDSGIDIASDTYKARLLSMSADEFPKLPEASGKKVVLQSGAMAMLIQQSEYAIAETADSRYCLVGAQLRCEDGKVEARASDTHRLAISSAAGTGDDMTVVVPAKLFREARALCAAAACDVAVHDGESQVSFVLADGSQELHGRKIEGEFPKLDRVIPKNFLMSATAKKSRLQLAVRRAAAVAEKNSRSVFLDLKPGLLVISATTAVVGEAADAVPVDHTGGIVKAAFQYQYLLDALESAPDGDVSLELSSDVAPMVVRPKAEAPAKCFCVVMPTKG